MVLLTESKRHLHCRCLLQGTHMKRYASILMKIGLTISMGFGLWHFIIPYQYKWYSYIPDAPRAIVVSIDWINFFFSLFLTGTSLILIIFQKRIKKAAISTDISGRRSGSFAIGSFLSPSLNLCSRDLLPPALMEHACRTCL